MAAHAAGSAFPRHRPSKALICALVEGLTAVHGAGPSAVARSERFDSQRQSREVWQPLSGGSSAARAQREPRDGAVV